MIKQAAIQYFYSIDYIPIEDWTSAALSTQLATPQKRWVTHELHEVYECMALADVVFEVLHLEKVMKELQPKKITACIPFQGFYESEISSYLECELDEDGVEEPESWQEVHNGIAQTYAGVWGFMMNLPIKFRRLVSPKFYNFETDRIEVEISEDCVAGIRVGLLQNERFREYIVESCTSRDGFISFLSPDLDDWNDEWGHKEVTRALEFLEMEEHEIEERIIEDMRCNGGFSW